MCCSTEQHKVSSEHRTSFPPSFLNGILDLVEITAGGIDVMELWRRSTRMQTRRQTTLTWKPQPPRSINFRLTAQLISVFVIKWDQIHYWHSCSGLLFPSQEKFSRDCINVAFGKFGKYNLWVWSRTKIAREKSWGAVLGIAEEWGLCPKILFLFCTKQKKTRNMFDFYLFTSFQSVTSKCMSAIYMYSIGYNQQINIKFSKIVL